MALQMSICICYLHHIKVLFLLLWSNLARVGGITAVTAGTAGTAGTTFATFFCNETYNLQTSPINR